jgi:hypothetical protein
MVAIIFIVMILLTQHLR